MNEFTNLPEERLSTHIILDKRIELIVCELASNIYPGGRDHQLRVCENIRYLWRTKCTELQEKPEILSAHEKLNSMKTLLF